MKHISVYLLFIVIVFPFSAYSQSQKSNELFARGVELYEKGKYLECIKIFEQCSRLDSIELPAESSRLGYAKQWIASAYQRLGNTAKAMAISRYYYAKPVDRRETILSDSLAELGNKLNEDGNTKGAIEKYLECAKIEKHVVGENHPWYANSLCNIGVAYYNIDENDKAMEYFNKGLEIHSHRPIFDTNYFEHVGVGVVINYNLGNIVKARELAEHRAIIAQKIDGIDSLEVAKAYCDFALIDYNVSDDYKNCIKYQLDGLNIYRRYLDNTDKRISEEENVLIKMYNSNGQYAQAAELLQIQANRLKNSNNQIDEYCEKLDILASMYNKIPDYAKAISVQETLIGQYKKITNRRKEATALDDLARYVHNSGNTSKATEIIDKAKSMLVAEGDTIGVNYLSVLNTSSEIYSSLLMWNKASEALGNALEIAGRHNLEDTSEYYRTLNIAMIMANKAGLNDFASNLNMKLLRRHLKDETKVDSLSLATDLHNYGSVLMDQGTYDEALQFLYKALTIRYNHLNPNHPDLATSYNSCAHLLYCMKEYDAAIQFMDHAINILEKIGKTQVNYPHALRNRATIHLTNNNKESAMRDICNAIQCTNRIIQNEFSYLSPIEQKHFWREYRSFYEKQVPNYVLELEHPVLNSSAYDALLISKGILLNTENSLSKLIMESGNKEAIEKYAELTKLQEELNRLYKLSFEDYKEYIQITEGKITSLQRSLVLLSKEYGDYTAYMNVGMNEIQKNLKKDEIAVEFFTAKIDSVTTKYCALVLNNSSTFPILYQLCSENVLLSFVENKTLSNTELFEMLWKPIISNCKDIKKIYFSPSGILHNISIENAFTNDGVTIGEKYDLYRLSSTRNIALDHKTNKGESFLFGNIDYYATADEIIKANSTHKSTINKTDSSSDNVTSNELLAFDVNKSRVVGSKLMPLEGTKFELNAVNNVLPNSKVIENEYATEECIKSLSGLKLQVLHIATHGVYYSENTHNEETLEFMHFGDSVTNVVNKESEALSRSALLLAGADNTFQGECFSEFNIEDGILTAQEISTLDFRGLDLVTLSACETAKGDISGDGVFGLQRGFKKAGATSILMSLWKVDDGATAYLMKYFYTYLVQGCTKHDSLEKAKAQVKKVAQWEAPKYWAAFILLDGLD